MTQQERTQLQQLLAAALPSADVRLSRDRFGVMVYDPVRDHYLKLADCHDTGRAQLIVECLRLAQELVAA